ncbi:MAG: 4-hydroxy-tetrahydrodipicolinate reductase [Oscillospiraceae bacterium]|nr:4-hydroxy-tetrahydrodipicolinate reductase [Oscillospiraceae bacterium]
MKTKIIISGISGKMGRVVTDCIRNRSDCEAAAGIDLKAGESSGIKVYRSPFDCTEKADVLIDFSHPSSLGNLLVYGIKRNLPLVIATTGYSEDEIDELKRASHKIPVFFSFNMSLGINLLAGLAKKAAEVLGGQFDIEIIEKHHNQKIDAPSGTAIMLADKINSARKYEYVYDRHGYRAKRASNEIGIHTVRGGTIPGEHEIIFAGRDEVLTMSHSAISKEIFAAGAVNAAMFLQNKPAGLYDMSDIASF